jgi:hypothetical protein
MEDQNPCNLRLLKKLKNKVIKPKNTQKGIPKNPRDLPSMVANFDVGGKSPYRLALRV